MADDTRDANVGKSFGTGAPGNLPVVSDDSSKNSFTTPRPVQTPPPVGGLGVSSGPALPLLPKPTLPSPTLPAMSGRPSPEVATPKLLPPVPAPSSSYDVALAPGTGDVSEGAGAQRRDVFQQKDNVGTGTVKAVIRTMESDLHSSSQGGIKGQEVKIAGQMPKPAATVVPVPVAQVKPVVQAPANNVSMGPAEKRTTPLTPTLPVRPNLPPPPITPSKITITAPTGAATGSGSKRSLILVSLLILVLLGGGAYYWFVMREPSDSVVMTLTPTPSETVTPEPEGLAALFPDNSPLDITATGSAGMEEVLSEANAIEIDGRQHVFYPVTISSRPADFVMDFTQGFFNASFGVGDGPAIVNSDQFAVLVSLQTEGAAQDSTADKRIGLIVEVADEFQVGNQMESWEASLAKDFQIFFGLPAQNKISWLDNTYRGVAIRYANFPNPGRAIDYAIIHAIDGKDYLVIASSREQMYGIIDTLLGF